MSNPPTPEEIAAERVKQLLESLSKPIAIEQVVHDIMPILRAYGERIGKRERLAGFREAGEILPFETYHKRIRELEADDESQY
jgi:hypothetical protein